MFQRHQIQLLAAAGMTTEKIRSILVADQIIEAELKAERAYENAMNTEGAGDAGVALGMADNVVKNFKVLRAVKPPRHFANEGHVGAAHGVR